MQSVVFDILLSLATWWMATVSTTGTLISILGGLASDDLRERIRKNLFGKDDVEASSSIATDGIVNDILLDRRTGIFSINTILSYCLVVLLAFVLIRILDSTESFFDTSDNILRVYQVFLVLAVGLASFSISLLASRLVLYLIRFIPDALQGLLIIFDLFLNHTIFVVTVWVFGATRIGLEKIIQLPGSFDIAGIGAITAQIFSIPYGLHALLLAVYFGSHLVTILLGTQIGVGYLSRFISVQRQSIENDDKMKRIPMLVRRIFSWWSIESPPPILALGVLLILAETALLLAGHLIWLILAIATPV